MLVGNYSRKCKDSKGGIKSVWLLSWKQYSRSQVVTVENTVVTFPQSFVYKFESVSSVNVEEKMNENEGGKYYEQSLTMSFKSDWSRDFDKLLNKDYRILTLDNNGLYRILGLWKGLECKKIDFKTGGAKGEMNGYTFTLEGQEEKQSYFINNPFSNGFIEDNSYYLLLQNSDNILTQNSDKIIYRNG